MCRGSCVTATLCCVWVVKIGIAYFFASEEGTSLIYSPAPLCCLSFSGHTPSFQSILPVPLHSFYPVLSLRYFSQDASANLCHPRLPHFTVSPNYLSMGCSWPCDCWPNCKHILDRPGKDLRCQPPRSRGHDRISDQLRR